ncbi:MAG: rod shape-determining protein [Clostridia bacterium]
MMFGQEIGIDLGTATVLIYVKGKGIVLREPSVVAIEKSTKKVVYVGNLAEKMIGRTPSNIETIRPLKDGVISNYEATAKMLKFLLRKVCGKTIFKPRVMVCIPSTISEVEDRAVREAAYEAGAKFVELIEEPRAAAMGAGIDIKKPMGSMIVDVGGGTTDVAVISFGSIVKAKSIKVAGDKFDEAIIKYIRKTYNILIGEPTAEEVKIKIGCLVPFDTAIEMDIKGRNLDTGLPMVVVVNSDDIYHALKEPISEIIDAIHIMLSDTPPELVGDISENGIVLTGGGALIYGFAELISDKIGIPVVVAKDPIECVVKGTGIAMQNREIS